MASPRYKSRSHYRTRQSAGERSAIEPSQDFGATALDRPLVDLSALPPKAPLPKTQPLRAPLPETLAPKRSSQPSLTEHRHTLTRVALTVLLACVFGGVLFGAVLGLSRC